MVSQTPRSLAASSKRKLLLLRSLLTRELKYIEFHITDHCNLKCKGCLHYSSIAPEWCADPEQIEFDMKRLSQLFKSIKTVRILGGEPLLHPQADQFIHITRTAFPKTDLRFVTNGVLIPKAPEAFWNSCRTTGTTIDWTVYPPMEKHSESYQALCREKGVEVRLWHHDKFITHINPKGDSDPRSSFRHCFMGSGIQCRLLKQGHIHTCPMAAFAYYYNDKFNSSIVPDKGINIHDPNISARKILTQLNKPIESCRWCHEKCETYRWELSSQPTKEDWYIEYR